MFWSILHNLCVIFLNGMIVSFMFLKSYIFVFIAVAILLYFTYKELEGVDRIAMKPPHEKI